MYKVFVVEDNEWYNKLLVKNIELFQNCAVESFTDGKSVLKKIKQQPDIITLDYRLPDFSGEELLKRIKQESPETEVIIISEQEDIETAVDLIKLGAYDYIVKTKNIRDNLLNSINHITNHIVLKEKVITLEKEVGKKYDFQSSIIGQSDAMQTTFNLIEKATTTDITVNLTGETGTGKEVVAKTIHYNSKQKKGKFIAVNMAAIPSDLIESELFGHEKGAFTGANAQRIGKFEEADNGTLFLDEIGELDISFQAKLLRVLQEKEIVRLGGNEVISVNCRIIVATHKNLQEEVSKGNFREDLFYRLFGLSIHLPPLRERGNDVLILANHFISSFCNSNQLTIKSISDESAKLLLNHRWNGNIRELKSVVELAVVLSTDETITEDNLNLQSTPQSLSIDSGALDNLSMREFNRKIVKVYMKKFNDNTKLVAEKLDIGQTTVYRLLNEDK